MKLLISDNSGAPAEVDICREERGYRIRWADGSEVIAEAARIKEHLLHLKVGDRSVDVPFLQDGNAWEVAVDTVPFRITAQDPRDAAYGSGARSGPGEGVVAVNMPGKVVQLLVHVGDRVTEGQGVVVVEAMKMENEIKSPCAGTVTAVRVTPGDAVESGQTLLEVAADEG